MCDWLKRGRDVIMCDWLKRGRDVIMCDWLTWLHDADKELTVLSSIMSWYKRGAHVPPNRSRHGIAAWGKVAVAGWCIHAQADLVHQQCHDCRQ